MTAFKLFWALMPYLLWCRLHCPTGRPGVSNTEADTPQQAVGLGSKNSGAEPAVLGQRPARMAEAEAIVALRSRLEENDVVGELQFSGTVLVAKNNRLVFEQAYGLADREKKIANRLDTKFRIGSMNKMFTAVAIAQLAQAGKLQFTDRLGKYFTDYPNADVALYLNLSFLHFGCAHCA